MKRSNLGWLLVVAACAEPKFSVDQFEVDGFGIPIGFSGGSRSGGWDGNRGGWQENVVGWDGSAGADPFSAVSWALDGTGPGTLANTTLLGLDFLANDVVATPCAELSAIQRIRARSSRGGPGAWTGPDVEVVELDGTTRWLGAGETVLVRGRAYNGYLHHVAATFRVTRTTTFYHQRHPGNAWPGFHVEACKDGDAATGFTSVGVVSFMPFFRLPELAGQSIVWHSGLVQPISIPYSTQPAALPFKFVANAGLPVALAGEIELDPAGCWSGTRVANREFILAGALALGNASWVTGPLGERRFIAFFTRTGNPVQLFARVAGFGAESVCVAGSSVDMLELAAIDLAPESADKLDAIATGNTVSHLPGFDQEAAWPTHLASGRSSFRRTTYRDTSDHPDREDFLEQLAESIESTRLGARFGAVQSQEELLTLLVGRADFVVAAQSPVPVETSFDPPPPPSACGNSACEHDETCSSCPGDCSVCDDPPPWEEDDDPPLDQDAGPEIEPMPDSPDAGTGGGSGSDAGGGLDAEPETGTGDGSGSGFDAGFEPEAGPDDGSGSGSGSGSGG